MLKKALILLLLCTPCVAFSAQKDKKTEPVTHLTDEQIYQELNKITNIFFLFCKK